MPDLLCIEGLRAGYGEAVVLPDLSLRLAESQVLALLGRNGTGKTTLINSIVGVTRRFGGTVSLGGVDITRMRPASGLSTPVKRLITVVLPAPFGPISAWRAPCSILSDRS